MTERWLGPGGVSRASVRGVLAGQSFNPAEFTDGASQLITFARVERRVFDSKSPGKPSEVRRVATSTNGKSLSLNKTNLRLLVKWFGPRPSDWIGRQFVIYRDESVSYAGQLVGDWRLRRPTKHDLAAATERALGASPSASSVVM